MSEIKPTLSLRYILTLEESQDGFALATFGKKQFTRFITPVISIGIIIWGFYLGFDGVGRYYIALGTFFFILQILMRYWFLPLMFKRQFVKYQIGKSEQGIDLYQAHAEIFSNGHKKVFQYTDVQKFAIGRVSYMLELKVGPAKSPTAVIVPKSAFKDVADQTLFENTFKK
ncbi:hypothetical protein B9T31_10955 [Acinetobacter sp. ANC 4558]|uniref:hypothetical protein n=1 Tax=Acinetobacter sp. ANC 4558 TaxID=1977876 RepID=UPI000A32C8D4|nr:hypothetical protein [Acinetobacter sp. ANC 4558]OTG85672.1 hypothetical protein B9T31_10955 [Acinetobacter sp. ANC 4558]